MLLGSKRVFRHTDLSGIFILAILLCPALNAQYRGASPPKKTNPRALAVLQEVPGGNVRLFPVSIFLDGKYYDARFYYAKPVPLALYDETVYIALKDGMPVGQFTVHQAMQVPDSSTWWGIGDWKQGATADSAPKSAEKKEEDRPVLHNAKEDADRPTLKKPGSPDEKPTDTASNAPPKSDDDPDRPILRKPKPGQNEPQVKITAADMTPKMPPEDPDRPVLTRKVPVKKPDEPVTITAPKTGIPGAKYMVAISDPDPMNNRPFDYNWSESEHQKWLQQFTKLGLDAARKFSTSGETRTELQPSAKFAETQLRALDLDYSNSPYIVFTGRIDPTVEPPQATTRKEAAVAAPPQLATYYVTLVARLNSQGQLTKLLTVATDAQHLDLHPRLDFIDAVDANGDNRAELLFRKTTDSGSSYVLYQMTPFQMTQTFEGGSGN